MSFEYELIRSDRKTLSLEIKKDGKLLVRAPKRLSVKEIERFVGEKSAWIDKHRANRTPVDKSQRFTKEEISSLAERALEYIPRRVRAIAAQMGVTVGNITIRCQRTRWGSCSSKGNLNFNCLLMLCPPEVIDYVVTHELAHREEMNHSARFWAIVQSFCPDYKTLRAWLKNEGSKLIAQI